MIQTLSDALSERGYLALTPVQEAVSDPALGEADLLVSAQTGSGKTVGFGLAIAATLMDDGETLPPPAAALALVIAPTRELAFQVKRELEWLYAKAGARVVSCVGGMDMRDERRALERGAHIVVGTPGRLRDHIQRGSLDMGSLRAVVLDEADEMLDMGFREDLEFMLGAAPEDRRTLMFSATVPPAIATLAKRYQRDAVRVTTLTGNSQHADISYQALRVAQRDAENAIINVLRYHDAENAIVFANTRAAVNRLTARFSNRGFAVVCLSGELSQSERTHALQAMRDGRARVCVATDVAARGLDLPNLDLVIHAELPSNAEGLLHRSGRTGRAGRKGLSALIVPAKATGKAQRLLKFAKIEAEWTTAPSADDILRRDEDRLLADPAWSEPVSGEEAEFAAKLLAAHAPELVAAAYLRLYRAGVSAPEELSDPGAKPDPAADRAPFGPSVWFTLSVGREDRAEARWLLPLLCRAGNLDKSAIGAIRVQQNETFVELREASAQGFETALGADGTLENGVRARRMDGPPDGAFASRPPRRESPRPPRRKSEPDAKGRDTALDRSTKTPAAVPASTEGSAPEPARKPEPAVADRDARANSAAGSPGDRPYRSKPDRNDKPRARKSGPKSGTAAAKSTDARSEPAARQKAPAEGRKPPRAKYSARPAGSDANKGGPGDKPGKPGGAKGEKPVRRKTDAKDTSKRFVPPGTPGKAKSGKPRTGKPASASRGAKSGAGKSSGHEPPRRRKP